MSDVGAQVCCRGRAVAFLQSKGRRDSCMVKAASWYLPSRRERLRVGKKKARRTLCATIHTAAQRLWPCGVEQVWRALPPPRAGEAPARQEVAREAQHSAARQARRPGMAVEGARRADALPHHSSEPRRCHTAGSSHQPQHVGHGSSQVAQGSLQTLTH